MKSLKFGRAVCFVVTSTVLLCAGDCGGDNNGKHTPPLTTPVSVVGTTPATCGGEFTGVSPGTMSGNEITLADNINVARISNGFTALPSTPVMVGVAQWCAQDMAAHGYVGIVGSDGEDVFNRIVCSGGTGSKPAGVVAIGYSTDPQAVFDAILTNYSASYTLIYETTKYTNLSVGYSGGYWMVIIGE